MGRLSFMANNYYPEGLGHSFVINTSITFQFIWAIAKNFMDEKTIKKVSIHGSNYLEHLTELVDMENLPSFFGGKCTCSDVEGGCLYSDKGPWS